MPGLIKVGYSLKDPSLRASELNSTATPRPFFVIYEVLVNNPRDMERELHRELAEYHEGKEWFRCRPEVAVDVARKVTESIRLLESLKVGQLSDRSDKKQVATGLRDLAEITAGGARCPYCSHVSHLPDFHLFSCQRCGKTVFLPR